MTPATVARRIFAGEETGVALALLLGGTLLVPAFVPGYLAILFASGVRNVFLPSLGSGVAFYAVAFLVLYLEAVVLTVLYLGIRLAYQRVTTDSRSEAA